MTAPRLAWVLLVLGIAVSGCHRAPDARAAPSQEAAVVLPDGFVVQIELATTPEQHARGLMYVKELPADRGMLFLFDTAEVRPFWMKNCFITLDMIWLDRDNRVVDITREAKPCDEDPCPNYYPAAAALDVLEVQGGLCAAHRLVAGDVLSLVNVPPAHPNQ